MKYWSRHSFGTCHSTDILSQNIGDPFGNIRVKNEDGLEWTIGKDIFVKEFVVADEFTKVVKASRTAILEKIITSPATAMSVCFRKKADTKTVAKEIMVYVRTPRWTKAGIQKIIDTSGESRVMIGRHYGDLNEHGRIMFFDAEAKQMKQVDPRTIEWAVIKGVKYEAK
jgi:threonine synthase